ncbi:hypothetical protein R1sor_011494 [Riccia sorocarpa]|uniref:NAD-dependent epimerase/dehydratase domain-containing protein n=1 Tax=Riccia sorocarpa TaxID=122646 RepID=A0ABD3I1E9_9MARC
MADKTVVVIGASGFIASWIVKKLLKRGYKVRGTVRNPDDVGKVEHLLALPGAKERLSLHKAELLDEGAYDQAVDGADYIIHSATPVNIPKFEDPYKEVIDPTVEGTLGPSTEAVIFSNRFIDKKEDAVVDESWWSDSEFSLQNEWYDVAGKTLAEKSALDFAKSANFDVVSIMPSCVIGTMLQKCVSSVPWSNNQIQMLLKGIDPEDERKAVIRMCIDVEDVATAHILAVENPSAEGRYLTSGCTMNNDQLALFLSKHHPEFTSVVKPPMDGKNEKTFMKPTFKLSTQKVQNLGLRFTPITKSVKKAVESLKQMNKI